ncbi:hypothetical protein DL93DRAFT_573499 [Clavulina sp. PMI_390]|nr:hypothetical protein DL93DRAFT_573499 [Clavulina sp. PMI_390]
MHFGVKMFDARLLLSTLPRQSSGPMADPVADVGWDDLDSDAEDTFFMSTSEIDAFKSDKRRREMEINRQKRMRALEEKEAAERDPNDPAGWGGSDEEPDENQHMLMVRTAASVAKSPNPQQLEMRILANHGSDPRFAFLRGRWKRAWNRIKNPPKAAPIVSSAMADYSDSGSDTSEAPATIYPAPQAPLSPPSAPPEVVSTSEAASPTTLTATQAERRARAKLWAAQRREPSST